jgi:Spy/CpxP family protein refolding chaperone
MHEPNDEQFENYLKNFRPIDPEPLPLRTKTNSAGARRRSALAVSAVTCLAAAALVVIALPRGHEGATEQSIERPSSDANAFRGTNDGRRQALPTIALTKLALDDRQAFDDFMTDKNQSQFPPMNTERSALRVLAKE